MRTPRTEVIDTRYSVPPEYAARWLTDLRPDDGPRFFGAARRSAVRRVGRSIHVEGESPLGTGVYDVTLDSGLRWSSEGRIFGPDGRTIARSRLIETVSEEGGGTRHRVEVRLEPAGWVAGLALAFGWKGRIRALRDGLARMKSEMEEQYQRGVPPALPTPAFDVGTR